ncbi:hypothetical protein V2J09_004305 [Rumex salicifolius]
MAMAASWALHLPVSGNPSSENSSFLSPSTSPRFLHLKSSASAPISSLRYDHSLYRRLPRKPLYRNSSTSTVRASVEKPAPLKIMISGAPASGKGTQCELITKKYGLVHIAAGDLLRAEISSGSENGKLAKEYMEKGQLVPDEIVVKMVKDRLSQPDSTNKGWLLDGYPRSSSQANALKGFGFQPDLFILLEVSEDMLVERVAGRRLDPVTGKIYHLKYSPPENEEIAARLTQRFDDTEEKAQLKHKLFVKLRLSTHHQNVEAVLSIYDDVTVNGNASKDEVFAQIDAALSKLLEQK